MLKINNIRIFHHISFLSNPYQIYYFQKKLNKFKNVKSFPNKLSIRWGPKNNIVPIVWNRITGNYFIQFRYLLTVIIQ